MIRALIAFIRDLGHPSPPDQNAHWFFCGAVAHAVLGAAVFGYAEIFAPRELVVPLVIVAYWTIKEVMLDLRRGGSLYDSVIDTAFIAMGALHAWAHFNLAVLLAALLVTAGREVWLARKGPR